VKFILGSTPYDQRCLMDNCLAVTISDARCCDCGDGSRVTKVVGMDCEMVGVGEDGKDSMLARVSVVNQYGCCIYDKFVKPTETVTDYRTRVSGVRRADLLHGNSYCGFKRCLGARCSRFYADIYTLSLSSF